MGNLDAGVCTAWLEFNAVECVWCGDKGARTGVGESDKIELKERMLVRSHINIYTLYVLDEKNKPSDKTTPFAYSLCILNDYFIVFGEVHLLL